MLVHSTDSGKQVDESKSVIPLNALYRRDSIRGFTIQTVSYGDRLLGLIFHRTTVAGLSWLRSLLCGDECGEAVRQFTVTFALAEFAALCRGAVSYQMVVDIQGGVSASRGGWPDRAGAVQPGELSEISEGSPPDRSRVMSLLIRWQAGVVLLRSFFSLPSYESIPTNQTRRAEIFLQIRRSPGRRVGITM